MCNEVLVNNCQAHVEPLESLWNIIVSDGALQFSKRYGNGNLKFRPFHQMYINFSNPIRGEKRKKRYVLIRCLSTNADVRSKSDSCTPKNIILILWITVKQCGQECARGKES